MDVNSGSIRENFDNQQRYYRPKSLPSASVRSQDIAVSNYKMKSNFQGG